MAGKSSLRDVGVAPTRGKTIPIARTLLATAGYKFRNWDMYGYVNNITDKEYIYRASIGEIKNHVMFGPGRLGYAISFKLG